MKPVGWLGLVLWTFAFVALRVAGAVFRGENARQLAVRGAGMFRPRVAWEQRLKLGAYIDLLNDRIAYLEQMTGYDYSRAKHGQQ